MRLGVIGLAHAGAPPAPAHRPQLRASPPAGPMPQRLTSHAASCHPAILALRRVPPHLDRSLRALASADDATELSAPVL